jgi:glycosyltransferase involved in cell wall biosynthesis
MPFFSVVIPTYNCEKFIAICCMSVLEQVCQDFEIIIQDGLSTDGTLNEIDKLKRQYPSVSWSIASEKDTGIYDAMNKGIIRSSGTWLLFLGADDRLYDQYVFESARVSLQESAAKMVYGNVKLVGGSVWATDSDVYDGPFSIAKLFKKNICHQAIFYKRIVFNELGYFNTRFDICADWDFNFRCFAKTGIAYTDLIISFFAGGGLSNTGVDKFREESIFILKDYYKISYFNRLFKTYSWVFLHHSITSIRQWRLLKSLHYLLLSFYHASDKILLVKIVLRKMFGKQQPGLLT